MISLAKVKKFTAPFYESTPAAQDPGHPERILNAAKQQGKEHRHNPETLVLAAYLHGLLPKWEAPAFGFLRGEGMGGPRAKKIIQIAREVHTSVKPKSIEGKLLHDAHLIEGGKCFVLNRYLVGCAMQGMSPRQTIRQIEKDYIHSAVCSLPENFKAFWRVQSYLKEWVAAMKLVF